MFLIQLLVVHTKNMFFTPRWISRQTLPLMINPSSKTTLQMNQNWQSEKTSLCVLFSLFQWITWNLKEHSTQTQNQEEPLSERIQHQEDPISSQVKKKVPNYNLVPVKQKQSNRYIFSLKIQSNNSKDLFFFPFVGKDSG